MSAIVSPAGASTLVALAAILAGRSGALRNAPAPVDDQPAPELYGAGLFTTGAWDFFLAFSPDQRSALFGRADDAAIRGIGDGKGDMYRVRKSALGL